MSNSSVKVWLYTGLAVWCTMVLQASCVQTMYTYKEVNNVDDTRTKYKHKEYVSSVDGTLTADTYIEDVTNKPDKKNVGIKRTKYKHKEYVSNGDGTLTVYSYEEDVINKPDIQNGDYTLTENKYNEDDSNELTTQKVDDSNMFQIIYPGTKWCGDGNVSSNYDDLGYNRETDACCRQHDTCDDFIDPGASKHGLTNDGIYTKLNCDCNDIFYECLKNVSATTQETTLVGFIYFNVVGAQCYKQDYPITDCQRRHVGRCVIYELNHSAPKKWQWFDTQFF